MRGVPPPRDKRSARSAVLLTVVLVAAATAVWLIASLAQKRSERTLAAEVVGQKGAAQPLALQPEAPEEVPDPKLDRLLATAEAEAASVTTLDAAAHALLVRDRFEEAEPLVLRALAASPKDPEAAIHAAVLHGVLGDTSRANSELEALTHGPAGWEAWLFTAGFALRAGDDVGALRAFQQFRAAAPPGEVSPALEAEMAELSRRREHPKMK